MRYAKKVVSCILSLCLMLSLLVGVTVPAGAAETDQIRITCVGDSITAGYKASSDKMSYPSQLQEILGDGYQVTNVGSSGSTVIQSYEEGEAYASTGKYQTGLRSEPDIVILMIGTNDAIHAKSKDGEGKDVISKERQEEFRKDYKFLIDSYKNCGTNPEIILAYPTASVWDTSTASNYNTPNDRDEMNDKYLIPIIKEIAAEYNLQVLDTHNYTGSWTHPDLLKDGLHPSDAGYRKLAEFFANVILGNAQGVDGFFQENTAYSIVSKSSGKAMSFKNHSTDNNAGLIQLTDEDYESQAWKVVPIDHGYYQIVNRYSGKALDIPNSSKEQGKQIIQWNRGNEKSPNQHWKMEATGDGYWTFTSRINPTMVLNVEGNSKNDDAKIVQWPSSGADNEKWKLEVIPEVKRIPDGKIRLTCVGDSITEGIGASSGNTNYPAQLQNLLGDGYKVLNKGVSGSKVVRSTPEAYSKTNRYIEGIESNPDIVIIMLGTNDAFYTTNDERKAEFRKDYKALIEDYKNLPTNPKIILASMVSSVGEDNKPDGRDANNANNQIPIIEELAEEYKLQLLDVNTYTDSWTRGNSGLPNNYLDDGLHPNDAGYEKLAEFFADAVLEYMKGFTGDIQENTDYSIVAKSSGKAMSIEGDSTEGNAKICQRTDEDYESQAWRFLPVENMPGYYIIMNKYTGKVLNIPNDSKNEGTQIIQWGNNGAENELFLIEATSDGYWTISPKLNPQMCLTISKDSKDNGGAVIQQNSTGADNQKWRFEVIPEVKRLSDGKITITCVGDSITEGVGSSGGLNYPNQLKNLLGDDYWVYNVGAAGTTVQRSLDVAYTKTSNYKIGLESEPDVVIIFLGTNDAERTPTDKELEAFRRDYASLIEEYQNCGTNPKIILATYVTTVSKNDNSLNAQDAKNEQALIPIVKDLAKEYDLQVLDVHNYTGSWTKEGLGGENPYLQDGLHPNNAGYERLAKLYANAILGYMEEFTGDIQEDTTYTLVSRSSGKALTVKDNSTENNAGLCQMPNTKAESQVWKLVPAGHGFYQIVNEASGKALDVPGSSKDAGTQIVQYDKGDKDNQLWKIEATGDGYWVIAPKLSQAMALSVTGDSKEDGAAIVQNTYTDAINGQWRLEAVNAEQPNKPVVELTPFSLEGEVAVLENGAALTAAEDSSNGYTVRNLGGPNNGTLTLTFDAEVAGRRTLNIYYASDDNNRKMDVIVNGTSNQLDFAGNGSWSKAGEEPKTVTVNVKEGTNTIQLAGVDGGFTPNIDSIELSLTDTETQNLVTGLINSIPETVTDSDADKALINGVKLAYDKLDEEAKKQITNADKLNSAVVKLEAAIKGEEVPTTPENPGGSSEPTGPSNPSESSEATSPSNPSESSEATSPSNPGESSEATSPSDPGESSEPTNPSDPSSSSEATSPSNPSESSEATSPSNPSESSEPTSPRNPSESSEPTTPTAPSEPTAPSNPTTPSTPANQNGGTQQPGVKVQSIALSGISRKIAAGKKIKLSVEVTPDDATDTSLIWTTSNEKYATVDANGTVTTKNAGKGKKVTVIATAKDGSGMKGAYTIQIMQKAVKKIKLSADSSTLTAGKKMAIKAVVTPKASTKQMNNKLKWSSSKTKYASVNSKGVVTAKKAGKGKTVKITAQATDGSNKKAVFKIKIN